MDTIRSSAKNEVAIGLDLKSAPGADSPCVSCVGGKLARHTFPDQGSDADDVLGVVHIVLCGPFRVAAKDGSLYFLLLKDRKTRYVWVKPVAKKSDALPVFVQWLAVTERQTKKSVLMLRSDQGGEFLGKQFTDFVNDKGIVHDLTCPYTPQQNGMAEREMRSTLPPGTTPYQLLTGKKPDLSLARVWGCMAHFLVPEQQRGGKLQPKAKWGLHLGVSTPSKGWELLDVDTDRVVTTSDVVFYEEMSLAEWKTAYGSPLPSWSILRRLTSVSAYGDEGSSATPPSAKCIAGGRRDERQVDVGLQSTSTGEEQAENQVEDQLPTKGQAALTLTKEQSATGQSAGEPTIGEKSAGTPAEEQQDVEGSGNDGGDAEEVQPGPRRSGRLRRPPDFFVPAAFTTVYDVDDEANDLLYDDAEEDAEFPELDPDMLADPEHRWDISTMTVKEALASWKGPAVKAAMEEEIRSLLDMGTWELVERPPGVNVMKNRWVLTTKYQVDDTVEREKARLVVKGFTQVYSAYYDETFAPVGSYVTLRIFLNIVAVHNLNLMQLDMKNAFLQSKLDRVLYMSQPDYFNDGTGRVCKLLKSLYGLKQSPLLWYLALNDVLVGAGWKKSQVDEALYCKAGKLWLHQQGYADKLRRRFIDEEQTGRTLKTPVSVDAYAELTFDDEEAHARQEEEYRQKVGSLQFAATTTRPDIAFACSKLGSGLTERSDQHWREVDRCLAYLANTRDTALELGGGLESLELVGYVDADDAGDKQNRTSTSGYVFVYGGAAVSWSSQRIKCATLSSTESEYVAATEAGKEGRRLRFLLAEFRQLNAGKPTVLRVDNKSAITSRRGHGVDGQPQAHGPATGLAAAHGEAREILAEVRLADVGNGDNDVQQ
ncbi:unnamed protein product [Closterium sp. NIES-64]|nr:unnamed protein product [Closterium sp. NIES-64]